MNLNSNGAKAIAALVALNAGLLVAHHAPVARINTPAVRAAVASAQAQSCAARSAAHEVAAEARKAAAQARLQSREVAREMVKAQQDMHRATGIAPSSGSPRNCTTLNDYMRSLVSLGTRSLNAGI